MVDEVKTGAVFTGAGAGDGAELPPPPPAAARRPNKAAPPSNIVPEPEAPSAKSVVLSTNPKLSTIAGEIK